MPLTPDQLVLVRSKIGSASPPTDADLDAIFDRRGGLVGVVREVWEGRLATLIAQPGSFTIPGDYSQNTSVNISAIEKIIARYSALPDTSDDLDLFGVVGVTRMVRDACDPVR